MFDRESGQVYREWTLPRSSITTQDTLDWSRRRPYPLFTARGTRGPRSMLDMITNVIANNIGDISEEHLTLIPTRLLWRVWRFLEARGLCLHAWKILSKILLNDDDARADKNLGLHRFRQHICRPDGPLHSFLEPLTSSTTQFITNLVISGGCDFKTHELLGLADIKNLAVLEFIQPADDLRAAFPEVTDRLLRGWSEKPDPFPLLRVLRIWGIDSTTQESLQWLKRFPSLVLYDVMGSKEDWVQAATYAGSNEWQINDFQSGTEGSLLQYLMLLAPMEDARIEKVGRLARSIDSDLVSLCGDSRCSLKFVPADQTPPLLDFLTDTAKINVPELNADAEARGALACHGVPFEAWAFWLYSFIGQLSSDRDLESAGVRTDLQPVVGPFVLPAKPLASVFLGHSGRGGIAAKPAYVSRGLFKTKRYTFTRLSLVYDQEDQPREPVSLEVPRSKAKEVSATALPEALLRPQKRKRMDDILKGLLA